MPGGARPHQTRIQDLPPGRLPQSGSCEVVVERRKDAEESLRVCPNLLMDKLVVRLVVNAVKDRPCSQIDAAVESALLRVESHDGLLGLGGA